jgi:hypothetical protein
VNQRPRHRIEEGKRAGAYDLERRRRPRSGGELASCPRPARARPPRFQTLPGRDDVARRVGVGSVSLDGDGLPSYYFPWLCSDLSCGRGKKPRCARCSSEAAGGTHSIPPLRGVRCVSSLPSFPFLLVSFSFSFLFFLSFFQGIYALLPKFEFEIYCEAQGVLLSYPLSPCRLTSSVKL